MYTVKGENNQSALTLRENVMHKFFYTILIATTGMLITTGSSHAASALYFGISSEPRTLETQISAGTVHRTFTLTMHRGLVSYNADGKLSHELAERYELADDAKSLVFILREAKFHDGTPVTAADVKATFERIMAPQSISALRNQFEIVDSVEVINSKTVRLNLKRPSVPFIHYLALPEAVILPATWLVKNDGNPTATPIGAGPFKFVSWSRGREFIVEKFTDYYKPGLPKLDRIIFQFYSDENTRVNAIRSADVDLIDYVPSRELKSLAAEPTLRLASTMGPFMNVQFNTRFKPFSDPRVRRAVGYAIDRQLVINTAFDGVGQPLYGLGVPEGYPAYDPTMKNYFKVDREKAKALLAEAGYANGFEARMVSSSQYSFHQNTAIAVQAELAKIGINIKLDLSDWTTRTAKIAKADYDLAIMGTVGEITDPDWLAYHYYGGEQLVRTVNSAYFNDAEINALIDEGRIIVDPKAREIVYKKLTDRALELSPFVFLLFRDNSYAMRKNVTGFTNLPGFLTFLSGYSLENTTLE